jgi:hypothetical protein
MESFHAQPRRVIIGVELKWTFEKGVNEGTQIILHPSVTSETVNLASQYSSVDVTLDVHFWYDLCEPVALCERSIK